MAKNETEVRPPVRTDLRACRCATVSTSRTTGWVRVRLVPFTPRTCSSDTTGDDNE